MIKEADEPALARQGKKNGLAPVALLRPSEAVPTPVANCAFLGIFARLLITQAAGRPGSTPLLRETRLCRTYGSTSVRLIANQHAESGLVFACGNSGVAPLITYILYHRAESLSRLL